ncbi:MAG TPA: AAA family ATPase [Gaiella sp.]|nr:AAA family ATPase [Gaiella sp.]
MTAAVGRDHELAAIERVLSRAGDRRAVLVLEGEAGIGKTTVWREVTRLCEERGFRVLGCRPAQAEAKLAFASLADLLSPVADDVLAELPDPQRIALEVALLRRRPRRTASDPRAAATALLSVLHALAEGAPLLVAIDDAQWLDPASAAAFSFAVRRLDPNRPVAVLVSIRVEPGRAADVLGLGQVPSESVERVRLGPLSLSALYHVIEGQAGVVFPRPTLQRIEQASGGNPLFALELARALRESGERPGPGDPLPLPGALAELLDVRVARLPASERKVLLALALVSEPTTGLLERVAGPSAAKALERLVQAGLVETRGERIRPRHPLYATAVSSSAAPATRRALHARLAEVVDDSEERARHLGLSTAEPDGDVAGALEDAAVLARGRGAWESAAELIERASELTPDRVVASSRRRISAAAHWVHAGDRARARRLLEATLASSPSRPIRAEALCLLAEISYHDENFAEAERLYREALEGTDDLALEGAIHLGLGYVYSNLMDFSRGARETYRALARAEAIGDEALEAEALALAAMEDFLCGRGADWAKVERSLALEDHDRVVPLTRRPTAIASLLRLYVGRSAEAREDLRALCEAARERGDESDLAFVTLWLSWLETRSGDFEAAAALAAEAASLAALTGSASMGAWADTQRAYVHAHRGEIDATRSACAEAVAPVQRSGNLLPALWIGASLALLELSLGNPEAAWHASEPLTQALEQQGMAEPVPHFFLPDALEALTVLGELDRVEALLSTFEARARQLDRAWALATSARCRGLLQAARSDLVGAHEALDRALAAHERIELPFDRARALLVRGAVERRSGQRARAKASLAEAIAEFERMGAPLWAERARAELGRVPIRRKGATDGLTVAEARVAELVAQGRSNREVAQALFVSPKTVEANLTRIYRKLGVRSRAALASRLAASRAEERSPAP